MITVSIIIPAYNEINTIEKLLRNVNKQKINGVKFEIIVVDDGSTDGTKEFLEGNSDLYDILSINDSNLGKGGAVRNALDKATGDFVLFQDADLEYNPNDYIPMLKCLINSRTSVYGSRILGQIKFYNRKFPFFGKHPGQDFGPWLAGVFLTIWVFILFGRWITDTLTAYKIYPIDVIREMDIVTHGFETDHEITAKLINNGIQIVEVPIKYYPRSFEEGKKIKMRDGFVAIWTFVRFRFKNSIIITKNN